MRNIQLTTPGRQDSPRDVVPPTSSSGSHSLSLMYLSQSSADAIWLPSSTLSGVRSFLAYRSCDKSVENECLPSLHRVAMLLIHKKNSKSASEQLHTPFYCFQGRHALRLRPFQIYFTIKITDLLAEFEDDTFVIADGNDMLIARSAAIRSWWWNPCKQKWVKRSLVLIRQDWLLAHPIVRSSYSTITAQRSGNLTSPLTKNECLAMPSIILCVPGMTGRWHLEGTCESSVIRSTAA